MHPVRQLRRSAGLTQQALAELAGTSQATIAAYEAGTKSPTWRTIERMARSLELEPLVLFTPSLTRAEQQSLLLHRAIGERLPALPPSALDHARSHLSRLRAMHPHARALLDRWSDWLDGPVDALIARITDPAPEAREMRQVSPLVGVLSPGERREALARARRERTR